MKHDDEAREASPAERQLTERAVEVSQETDAMHRAFLALQPLGRNSWRRTLRWLAEALGDIEVPF